MAKMPDGLTKLGPSQYYDEMLGIIIEKAGNQWISHLDGQPITAGKTLTAAKNSAAAEFVARGASSPSQLDMNDIFDASHRKRPVTPRGLLPAAGETTPGHPLALRAKGGPLARTSGGALAVVEDTGGGALARTVGGATSKAPSAAAATAKIGLKTLGKGALRALPWLGTAYTAYELGKFGYDQFFDTKAEKQERAQEGIEQLSLLQQPLAKNELTGFDAMVRGAADASEDANARMASRARAEERELVNLVSERRDSLAAIAATPKPPTAAELMARAGVRI